MFILSIDDVGYIVLDEVIKRVDVEVVYVCFFYVGVVYVLGLLLGEMIGVLVGLSSDEVKVGIDVVL